MESESNIAEYDLQAQRSDSSPRGRPDYSKLPPIPNQKSPDINYSKKNKEIIKQMKEKRQKQQDIIEKARKKEEEERDKLRQLILEEAARVREQKKVKEAAAQIENNQSVEIVKPVKSRKGVDEKKEEDDEETEKEKEDKTKLYHFYRSRHVQFLKSLKENLETKKEQEEHIKKKKEHKINKIRESMGINNVASKFYDFDKPKERVNEGESAEAVGKSEVLIIKKSNSVREKERPHSSEAQTLTGEAQRALLERQKKAIAEIYEKKKVAQQAEEEKLKHIQRQREKLKEKVLGLKKTDEAVPTEEVSVENKAYTKNISANLKGLDLESGFIKKEKKRKPHLSLPPIRDKQDKDDEDDDKLYGGLEKIPESTKSSKKKKKKLPTFPNVTDMATWKKRHRLDPETKVFIINGGYPDIKVAMEKRGWIENPDQSSPCFDFKWTLRAKDIEHGSLLDHQIVNHFEKNTSITTKVGLCKSLRNLIWFDNVDIDTFYPKCFDLSDVHDYEEFLEEFKYVKAESILKQYVQACKANDPKAKDMELRVQVALKVCDSKLVDLDELLEEQAEIADVLVSAEEWEILSNDELTQKALALKKHEAWLAKNEFAGPKCSNPKEEKKPKKKKKKVKKAKANQNGEGKDGEGENDEENPENELLDRVEATLEEAKAKCPQYGINGDKNIWIVKPAGLSRGRGISCFRNLVEIQDYVKGKESQWVAQKYMENPLIVHRRKFDIRQWILVADWNPLTIWYYEECYVRFSAEEYDTENLDNKFVHLTNNSIGKYHENQNCPTFEQNMWKMEAFTNYLEEQYGSDVFNEKIKPQMKQCVIWALECVQDMVENRKNSHEFYGVDFMIDEDLNVWLIEINSSPDMEYSTPVTKRLVKTVSDDIVKVVIDYNLNPEKKKKKEIDTGLFTCIHKSKKFVDKPLHAFGLDLALEGKKISK